MRKKLKMRFSEFMRRYANYKYKETGIKHITENERVNLLKEFNKLSEKKIDSRKKRVTEGTSEERMSRYAEMRRGNTSKGRRSEGRLSEKRADSRANLKSSGRATGRLEERRTKKFSEMVSKYKDFKEKETGDRSVSYAEIKELREAFDAKTLNKGRLKNRMSESSKKTGRRSEGRLSEKKLNFIKKKLHEANFHVRKANRLLKENDMAGAEMAVDNATATVDAVTDMTAGAQVPQEVQTQIQSVMSAVEQLASISGVAPQNDMNGDIDANVAPAEGMGVVDENATMFERAMHRRSAILEEIDIPQAKKVASGVSKYAGKTWKPAAIKYSKTGSLTETKREDEKMVDELLNEKTFNYKDLFAKGILG